MTLPHVPRRPSFNVLSAALACLALAVAAVSGRAWLSSPAPDASAAAASIPAAQGAEEGVEVEALTLRPRGFEPAEVTRRAGRFLLAVSNHTGGGEVSLFSVQDNGFSGSSVEPTATMTGSQYVVTSFDVQYWTGTGWATVPGGSVTGNNLIWRRVTFPEVTTTKVRFVINATADNYSQVPEVEVWGRDLGRANHALSANGATAAASSVVNASYAASRAVDGDRKGANGVWADGTQSAYPDWLEVDFGGERRIDEVQLFAGQDDYAHPAEPTEAMTSRYALTDFLVQYWAGSAWVTVPGGGVTDNDRVWRRFSFPEVTTQKVRLWVTRVAGDDRSGAAEVEAWGPALPSAGVRWLVTDQLGTPRMALDRTGGLAGVTRHDYLPFGEELSAGTGGRTTAQGRVPAYVRWRGSSAPGRSPSPRPLVSTGLHTSCPITKITFPQHPSDRTGRAPQ